MDPLRPTLLVTGGSTGARSINRTVFDSIDLLLATGWQVLHITGAGSDLPPSTVAGYTMVAYCDRMELALAAADLAIARSGIVTVSEFAAVGLPAVFIPYPVGNGEQRFNAADAVRAGGALLVDDAEFTPAWVRHGTGAAPAATRRRSHAWQRAIATIGSRDGADRMVAARSPAQPG